MHFASERKSESRSLSAIVENLDSSNARISARATEKLIALAENGDRAAWDVIFDRLQGEDSILHENENFGRILDALDRTKPDPEGGFTREYIDLVDARLLWPLLNHLHSFSGQTRRLDQTARLLRFLYFSGELSEFEKEVVEKSGDVCISTDTYEVPREVTGYNSEYGAVETRTYGTETRTRKKYFRQYLDPGPRAMAQDKVEAETRRVEQTGNASCLRVLLIVLGVVAVAMSVLCVIGTLWFAFLVLQ